MPTCTAWGLGSLWDGCSQPCTLAACAHATYTCVLGYTYISIYLRLSEHTDTHLRLKVSIHRHYNVHKHVHALTMAYIGRPINLQTFACTFLFASVLIPIHLVYLYLCRYLYVCVHVYMCIYAYRYTYTFTYISIHLSLYLLIYLDLCCAYTYRDIRISIYIYIYMYIHLFIHAPQKDQRPPQSGLASPSLGVAEGWSTSTRDPPRCRKQVT